MYKDRMSPYGMKLIQQSVGWFKSLLLGGRDTATSGHGSIRTKQNNI
jgi:hypothetical protein